MQMCTLPVFSIFDQVLPELQNNTTVQLNIVENDENLTREPRCEPCCDLFFGLTKIMLGVILCLVLVSMVGGVFFGIGYLFYIGTTPSVIVGLFLVWVVGKMFCHFCY